MANNFHRLSLRKRHIYYVRCLVREGQAILLQHLESTQLYKKYGDRVQHSVEHKLRPLGLPYHTASTRRLRVGWPRPIQHRMRI